jgi:aspartyl-tRNA(Asn)/glutamyl-tRNA(Gln) amidotransferase subunit A
MKPALPPKLPELCRLNVAELRAGYLARAFSPVEVFDSIAARVAEVEPVVHAFTTLTLDEAHAEAMAAETAYTRGRPRPLEGIPFAAKDLFDTQGLRTTYGSAMFLDHVPGRDAEAIRRLRRAGALLVGKTSTHEFAWGITSVNQHVGTPLNPWLPTRITGGSSGGSAAAVAALMVPFALATDTGGSVRIPSSFCGVVGLKPTFGAISAAGVFPLSPSLDHPSLMARDPGDVADLLDLLSGFDAADPATLTTIAGRPGPTTTRPPLRVGICAELEPVRLAPAVAAVMAAAKEVLAGLGAECVDVGFPEAQLVGDAFGLTQRAEAYNVHVSRGLYPQRAAEYGDDVRHRLEAAAEVDLAQYLRAQRDRGAIRAAFRHLFQQVDVLLTPASPVGPPEPGVDNLDHFGERLPLRSLVMPFMVPQDLAGLPAVVVRAGFDGDGIPIAIQLSGPSGADHAVLAVAQAFHGATEALQSRWPLVDPPE